MENMEEILAWARYTFFEKGIGPHEFERAQIRHIKEILDIKGAADEKVSRDKKIAEAIARMG